MPEWMKKRLVIGLTLFFLAVGVWEFRLKPQFRPMYQRGVALYQNGHYQEALQEFERAYAVAPNQEDVILMVGWSNLKLRRYEEARFYFQRAQRIEPRSAEAQLGAVYIAWHAGQRVDRRMVERLAARFPDDPDLQAMAAAVRKQGGGQ